MCLEASLISTYYPDLANITGYLFRGTRSLKVWYLETDIYYVNPLEMLNALNTQPEHLEMLNGLNTQPEHPTKPKKIMCYTKNNWYLVLFIHDESTDTDSMWGTGWQSISNTRKPMHKHYVFSFSMVIIKSFLKNKIFVIRKSGTNEVKGQIVTSFLVSLRVRFYIKIILTRDIN